MTTQLPTVTQQTVLDTLISDTPLDRLFCITQQTHPTTSETVLQSLLRDAWHSMTVAQKHQWLHAPSVLEQLRRVARVQKEDEAAVQAELKIWRDTLYDEIRQMREAVEAAGYRIIETGSGLSYWELDDEAGEDFHGVGDTVTDAYQHMAQHQRPGAPAPRG